MSKAFVSILATLAISAHLAAQETPGTLTSDTLSVPNTVFTPTDPTTLPQPVLRTFARLHGETAVQAIWVKQIDGVTIYKLDLVTKEQLPLVLLINEQGECIKE